MSLDTSASWIKENMLANCDPPMNNHMRPLSAAEIKVQRSLEKLSIPDWYLNSTSKPPKILKNTTPFELRPPAWKTGSYKTSNSLTTSTTECHDNGSFENDNGMSATFPDRKPSGRPKNTYINTTDEILLGTTREKKISPNKQIARYMKSNNISKSFPKISPSRKIQNINLVFPQTNSNQNDMESSILDMTISDIIKNSNVEEANINKLNDHNIDGAKIEKIDKPMFNSTFIKETENIPIKNNCEDISVLNLITTNDSCDYSWLQKKPLFKDSTRESESIGQKDSEAFNESYTPLGFNHTFGKYLHLCNVSNTPSKTQSFLNSPKAQNSLNASKPRTALDMNKPRTVISMSKQRILSNTNKSPSFMNPTKNQSSLKTIKEDNEISRPATPDRKSTEIVIKPRVSNELIERLMVTLRRIDERHSAKEDSIFEDIDTSSNKSLAEDIIDELRKKCRTRPGMSASARSSQNFVKKLVEVLEKSVKEDNPNYTPVSESNPRLYNTYDIESGLDSTSVSESISSIKISDNDEVHLRNPYSPVYNWSMQVNGDFSGYYYDEDNDIWTPVPKKLSPTSTPQMNPSFPRTSSLLSLYSRSSSRSSTYKSLSPCSSPDKNNAYEAFNYAENQGFWSSTFRADRKNRKLHSMKPNYSAISNRSSMVRVL